MGKIVLLFTLISFHFIYGYEHVCEEGGMKFKKGETITVECEQFTCEEPAINLMVGKKCNTRPEHDGCKFGEGDLSLPFPDCCPKEVC
ncbi:venom peptide HsVx1-like [Photinus pyralis]|uniref:venom peptide HsVx1-like n=1 Tax=Photinus pyralis TaxID=7054 RepID=UPI001267324D|nr:venom peptide HsVx1-like [Photinus pyralis]